MKGLLACGVCLVLAGCGSADAYKWKQVAEEAQRITAAANVTARDALNRNEALLEALDVATKQLAEDKRVMDFSATVMRQQAAVISRASVNLRECAAVYNLNRPSLTAQ